MEQPRVDYSKLSPELRDKLAQWEQNSPAGKQLQALSELQDVFEHLVITLEQGQNKEEDQSQQMGAILVDMRNALTALKDREDPATPDYAAPVVRAVGQLEKALTKAVQGIEVKPQFNPEFRPEIQVQSPNVHVPALDLRGVEAVLKTDLPRAFQEAIAGLPEAPETDLSPLTKLLERMSEQLSSIDIATRLKPEPGIMKVTNPDGSYINAGALVAKRVDTATTANTIYVGQAAVASLTSAAVWQIKKIDTTTGADATWADGNGGYDNIWDNRSGLSYS